MRILGVDPGAAVTGYGLIDGVRPGRGKLIECGVIRTASSDPLPDRLRAIYDGIREVVERHTPDVLAVEGVFYGSNVRTTVVLGHARGVVLLAAAHAGLPVTEYSPAVVKKTVVGRGAAAKAQVGYMVAQLLKLKTPPTPADAADGVAVALTHLLTTTSRSLRV